MCGICGVIQVVGRRRPVLAPGVIDRMTDAMTHRGPDDRGIFVEDGAALGARRLSIIDVVAGHQPLANEDGRIWAAQNGELYNHAEIRRGLERDGHRLLSRCDTEIIPHLYERDGLMFPERLTGKFAIAVWDGARGRAVLARDRLGIKPLYYARSGDLLVFASELKSLLASGLASTALDYEAIDAYLRFGFVPGPRTPLQNVRKLMPGHRLVIEDGSVREERYWEFPKPAPDETMSEGEAAERLLDELEQAVRRRLMSDVPLGAMLSGGLDSSLIVALMARNMSEPVKTFSVGFAEAGEANELNAARLVADAFGADHHPLELSFDEQTIDLANLAWSLDEPLADLSALGFLALSGMASRHVTVALSGQGADELLGGYSRHRRAALIGQIRGLPAPMRAAAQTLLERSGERGARLATAIAAVGPAARHLSLRSSWVPPGLHYRLVRPDVPQLDGEAALRAAELAADGLADDPLPASLYLDAQLGLVDDMIHYFDRASMARSLEVRVPFLDHHVVELCASIPADLKVRRLTTKYLLKRLARGIVPDWVIDKPKVGFFNGGSQRWMESQLRGPVADYLLNGELACGEFLEMAELRRMVLAHRAGDQTDLNALYAVLMLEVWLTSVLPRAAAPAPEREQIAVSA
ncbi:MAG: asparagine synthase (glutamine-hydrolyzing) [Solirubrobacteraceae bacterium]